jgi:acylphosphatase
MKVRVHIIISGHVQGVFFRQETQTHARKYKVTGWVRNRSDGKVEAILEGEKDNVEKLIEYCRKGPPEARVENIDIKWDEYKGEFQDFYIRY